MTTEHIQASTTHIRRGALENAFRYNVDFILTPPDVSGPALLSHNRFNLWSVWDRHYGELDGQVSGAAWFRAILDERGFPLDRARILLLTQPGFLWFQFNPVSFWIALIGDRPCAVLTEVNNTFGDRHCYFCAHGDFREITYDIPVHAEKTMHVSPFQQVKGEYTFNFGITDKQINIRIVYRNGEEGVVTTLMGERRAASSFSLLKAAVCRPGGGLRVLALIHWQALMLWCRKAPFQRKPAPPKASVSEAREFRKGRS